MDNQNSQSGSSNFLKYLGPHRIQISGDIAHVLIERDNYLLEYPIDTDITELKYDAIAVGISMIFGELIHIDNQV